MNCVVIDDEPLARKGMELLISRIPSLHLSACFSDVAGADEFLRANAVDILFLDIQMPGLSGMDYLRCAGTKANVIITTAYPQFAVEAFELAVVDYLVKPVRFERFFKAVSRASGLALKQPAATAEDEYIFIRTERRYVRTYFREISFIEGLKDYVVIYCGQEKHVVATNLKSITENLPPALFLRISKSHVVNMGKISAIENDSVSILNRKLPIGENFKKAVIDFVSARKVLKR
jgi:two-component system LytT family response regulator